MAYQIHSAGQPTSTQYDLELKPPSTLQIVRNQQYPPLHWPQNEDQWSFHFIEWSANDYCLMTHPHLQLIVMMMQRRTSLWHPLMTWYGLKSPYCTESYAFIWLWTNQKQVFLLEYLPHHRSPSMSQYLKRNLCMTWTEIYLISLMPWRSTLPGLPITTLELNLFEHC